VGTTYLDAILAHHRARAAADDRDLQRCLDQMSDLPPARDLVAALRAGDQLAVIAEIKRRSPSKGDLSIDLDPAGLAAQYAAGGAAAISVLTDGPHFAGSADDLGQARAAVRLPVLRKDFTVSELDVVDARAMGADVVLLIVAALSDDELHRFDQLARQLTLSVLVETHDEAEVTRALHSTSGAIVGVNQRDLVTFSVDSDRAVRVAASIPASSVKVAESGVRGTQDVIALAEAGYDAVLVGEHLVTAGDTQAALRALRVPR